MEPPPLPAPIRFATFHGKQIGLIGSNLCISNLEKARQSASVWLSANPNIEIITINTCLSDSLAAVTVWYRFSSLRQETRKPPNLPNQPS